MARITPVNQLRNFRSTIIPSTQQEEQNQQKFFKIQEMRKQFSSRSRRPRFILSQFQPFRIRWDIFVIVIAIYSCIMTPFRISFQPEADGQVSIDILDIVIDFVFIFDIFLNFRTSYIDLKTGEQITNPRMIALKYFNQIRFYSDLIASIPFDILQLATDVNSQYNLLKLLKLFRISKLGSIIMSLRIREDVKTPMKIVKLVMLIFIYLHCIACGWTVLVFVQQDWVTISPDNYYEANATHRYAFAMYMAISTLVGMEILPTSRFEYLYCMVWILAGALMITYILSEILQLLINLQGKFSEYNDLSDNIMTVMVNLKLDQSLQQKITKYVNSTYSYIRHNAQYDQFQKIVSKSYLKEINSYVYTGLLKKISYFSQFPQLRNFVIENLDYEFLRPDNILFREGDQADWFYLIKNGVLGVYIEGLDQKEYFTSILKGRDYCGEVSFVYNTNRTATVKALDYCFLAKLNKPIFQQILHKNEDFKHALQQKVAKYADPKKIVLKVRFTKELLKKIGYLRKIDDITLDQILYSMKKSFYTQNQIIFDQSTISDKVYFILKGSVTLSIPIYDTYLKRRTSMRGTFIKAGQAFYKQKNLQRLATKKSFQSKKHLVNLPLTDLFTGSIICGTLALFKQPQKLRCVSNQQTIILQLQSETITESAFKSVKLQISINSMKARYTHFSNQRIIIPPVFDCFKNFQCQDVIDDIANWRPRRRIKDIILRVLIRNREKCRKGRVYLKQLILRLKAIAQAENRGWTTLAKMIQNRSVPPQAIQAIQFLKISELKIPILFQFANMARQAGEGCKKILDQVEKATFKMKSLEKVRIQQDQLLKEVHEVINLISEYINNQQQHFDLLPLGSY